MGLYTLIFTETASGQRDHENYLIRRQTAIRRATALGITRPDISIERIEEGLRPAAPL
jgi:hypothetical protein